MENNATELKLDKVSFKRTLQTHQDKLENSLQASKSFGTRFEGPKDVRRRQTGISDIPKALRAPKVAPGQPKPVIPRPVAIEFFKMFGNKAEAERAAKEAGWGF